MSIQPFVQSFKILASPRRSIVPSASESGQATCFSSLWDRCGSSFGGAVCLSILTSSLRSISPFVSEIGQANCFSSLSLCVFMWVADEIVPIEMNMKL